MHTYPSSQGVNPVVLYGRMMLGEVSYAVLQAADLVRLVVEQDMQVAFIETRIKRGPTSYDGPSYVEFQAGLGTVQWSISAAQAGALPTQWQSVTGGANASRIRTPLRRWGVSRQRRFEEDRLLDCWLGLEGLLGGARTHIARAVAPAAASALGLNATQQAARNRPCGIVRSAQ